MVDKHLGGIPIVDEHVFFNKTTSKDIPSTLNIMEAAKKIKASGSSMIVLDIERWPDKGSRNLVNISQEKYKYTLNQLRKYFANKISVGYYGIPPVKDYWRTIDDKKYASWQQDNDNFHSLADDVDVFYPSLYTFYADTEGWKKYAVAQISEAKRLAKGKPVIVFLWPQYHESNLILGKHYIPAEFWRLQLETAYRYADGAIIWGGWKEEWSYDFPWWNETLSFMKAHGLN
jgi:hypothetical protein